MFLALHLTSAEAKAQPSLTIDATLGFSNTVRLGRWAPLTVTIENTGHLFKGHIAVEISAGDELRGTAFDYTWQHPLELPRGARKRFQLTVYVGNFASPVQIKALSNGKLIAQQQIDLRQRFTESKLIVVLSRTADLDYLNESSGGQIRVTYPHPDMLPEQWQGYDGVAAVVVHGVTLEHWSKPQFEALKQWLAQGGKLIVSGGPDYAALRSQRLASLLPAIPVGLKTVDDDSSFRTALGQSFVAPRPFQVHDIGENQANHPSIRHTLRAMQTPLAVESDYSLGKLYYFLFDIGAYPFADWNGMAKLWRRTLNWTEAEVEHDLATLDSSAVPELFKQLGHRFPARTILFSFLLAYLGVLLALYFVAGRHTRGKPFSIWLIPLGFIPVSYLLFISFLSPPRVSVTALSVIEPLGNGPYAKRTIDLGIVSNRAQLSSLEIEPTATVMLPRVDESKLDQAAHWVQQTTRPIRLKAHGKPPQSLHALWGEDILDLSIKTTVEQTKTGLRVDINNVSGVPLQVAWLVFDGWLYPIGTLPSVLDSSHQLDNNDVVAVNDFSALTTLAINTSKHQLIASETALKHTVSQLSKEAPLLENEALFIALTAQKRPFVRTGATVQLTAVDLLLSRIKVTLLADTGDDQARPYAR